MRFIYLFFTLAFISLSQSTFSQNTEQKPSTKKQITKMHYYSFTGQASQDQLDFLQQDLKNLEFVTEVKIEYKAEKGAGQVRLISVEQSIVSEGDKEFSPTVIKKTLVNKGLMPVEYHNETISTQ
ncbi:MAG: hypothetical protein V4506_02985 [Bacteroidota bacterium]